MLLPIDQLFNHDEVAAMRQQLASAAWIDGALTAGSQARTVKNNLQLDDQSPVAAQLRDRILSRLSGHPLFISATLPNRIYPPKFNAYRDGGHYGLHVDNAVLSLADGHFLRSDISATLFLTGPDDYDGGELCIETQYGAQQVKLNAGDLIIYPATSLHHVAAVTRGERIAAFFWIESLVRDPFQREQLFELDQSIQQLTRTLGQGNEEVTRLSTIYHNLLRQWAIT